MNRDRFSERHPLLYAFFVVSIFIAPLFLGLYLLGRRTTPTTDELGCYPAKGKKEKEQVSEQDKLVTSTLNVEFDSGTPQVTLGYEISQRSHICNCGFWNSEKVWGETLYTQQFGDSCKSMSITNNYVVCSKCGERLRRVKVTYLDDVGGGGCIVNL